MEAGRWGGQDLGWIAREGQRTVEAHELHDVRRDVAIGKTFTCQNLRGAQNQGKDGEEESGGTRY